MPALASLLIAAGPSPSALRAAPPGCGDLLEAYWGCVGAHEAPEQQICEALGGEQLGRCRHGGRRSSATAATSAPDGALSGECYRYVSEAAATAGFRYPKVLMGVVYAESRGDPLAVTRSAANGKLHVGCAQLSPSIKRRYSVVDRTDPRQNLEGAAAYLRDLTERFGGDVVLGVASFNRGPARVARARGYCDLPNLAYLVQVFQVARGPRFVARRLRCAEKPEASR